MSADQNAIHFEHPNGLGNRSKMNGNALSMIVAHVAPLNIPMKKAISKLIFHFVYGGANSTVMDAC